MEAASFSFSSKKSSTKNPHIANNRPWGNIESFKPGQKYEPPAAIPNTPYLGSAPGTGWYAAQIPTVGSPSSGGQPVVEVETSEAVVYEQQNIVYTVRVVSSDNLKTLTPAIPRIEGAVLEQVDGPVASTRNSGRNRTREIVNEYRFKLTPLRSGEIVIPAIRFTGTHVSNRQWNGVPGMPVSATDNSFSIASDNQLILQGLPADPAVTPWLPLNDLRLRIHMADSGPAKAGVPATLTLELTARGALGTQLPSLEQQLRSSNFRAYRDSVTTSNGISRDGTQLLGNRKETYTIIPLQDGWIRLPEIQVAWWDVDTDTPMLAGLPGQHAAANTAGNRHAVVATGGQEFFPAYFWAPMLIFVGLIFGYWLGAWHRTRPLLKSVAAWLSALGQHILQRAHRFGIRLSPVNHLKQLRMGLALLMPGSIKLWMCTRCLHAEDNPEAWCTQFKSRVCQHLDITAHSSLTHIAEKIIAASPQAEPVRLRALAHSLDGAIYGGSSLDFPAWKRELTQQLRPRLRRRRRSQTRRTKAMLPALNPRSA
jgi:hypothetical protein